MQKKHISLAVDVKIIKVDKKKWDELIVYFKHKKISREAMLSEGDCI